MSKASISRSIGATLIVTGTAVGAGMLAIPLVTASMGFPMSCILLVVCWAVMLSTALIILDVNLQFERSASFATMAKKTIGRSGYILTWLSICLLLYALCAAYITGGSSLFELLVKVVSGDKMPDWVASLIFTLFFGFFVFFGTRSVDMINRVLMFIKLGAFFVMVVLLVPHVHLGHLTHNYPHLSMWLSVPILMTSFGFHPVIPSVRLYIGDDVKRLRWIIIIGATLPLVIYLLWEICTLGVLPPHGQYSIMNIVDKGGSVADLVANLQYFVNTTAMKVFSNMFTDIAVTTSFLGVSLGLCDFLSDGFKAEQGNKKHRFGVWLLTFSVPLAFALFYPKGFVLALSYASIFVAVLLIVIPAWMRFEQVKRFSWGLALITLIGFAVIAVSVYQSV